MDKLKKKTLKTLFNRNNIERHMQLHTKHEINYEGRTPADLTSKSYVGLTEITLRHDLPTIKPLLTLTFLDTQTIF